ncbi:olfactory receptor 6B2-like, partial [Emydura macquarii macquarii]|uniref:olfactory receptor 6B2-like n=1 Tax=Emydura macquarii macquarii TaxID=1129001 RepID=UPI00352A3E8F
MYFFLENLSCLETCYRSIILPRMLASLLSGDKTISFAGCLIQFYTFGSLISTKCCLLSAMSYDRYLASGFAAGTITTCWVSQQIFCGSNEIDHFLCDYTPLIKLSCSDTSQMVFVVFLNCCIFILPPFLLTLISYMYIISAILRIPSSTRRQKAFSTCSSHLIVVTVFYGTLIIVYVLQDTAALHDLNKVFSIFYTVVMPMVNPLIYSLRNKEVKEALRKALSKTVTSMSISNDFVGIY